MNTKLISIIFMKGLLTVDELCDVVDLVVKQLLSGVILGITLTAIN